MFAATAMMLLCCLLLGGATGYGSLSDAILQMLAIPVLLLAIWRILETTPHRQTKVALTFCLLLVLVPLLQLVPLPADIWTALPGRELVTAAIKLSFDELPWMPISLTPRATWLSLLAILPFLAIFLSVQQLGYRDRRRLSLIIIAVAMVSTFIGLLQVVQGPSSPLRFYEINHNIEAIGFFANRNHFSVLLNSTIVIVVSWLLAKPNDRHSLAKSGRLDRSQLLTKLAGFIVIIALIAALLMARSRAGLALTMLTFVGVYLMSLIGRPSRAKTSKLVKLIGAAVVLALVFAGQFALFRVMERLDTSLASDVRFEYSRKTTQAAISNMPTGSGKGSFVPVYKQYETTQSFQSHYANQAHNDFLQVWLEMGVVGVLLMVSFAFWYLYRTYRIWRHPHASGREIDHLLARGATLVIALISLHSIVEYPLRTIAIMAVMAFAMALLIDPPTHALERDPEEFEESPPARKRHEHKRHKKPAPILQPMPTQPVAGQPVPVAPSQNPSPDKTPWDNVEWPEEWRKKD